MLSQHFLAAIRPGEIAIDVSVERVGRAATSVSARISSGDPLVGLATSIFSENGEGPDFLDDPLPDVLPPMEPDTEMVGFSMAHVHERFDFHRRFGTDGAVVPCEGRTPLLVRHRLSNGRKGLTDEDIALWSQDGRLLLRARQMRTVVPANKALGRD